MGNIVKLCVICGEDCSQSPRTKDKKGQYYHQSCYDDAREKQAATQAQDVEPSSLEIEESSMFESDSMNMLDDLLPDPTASSEGNSCPGCSQPVAPGAVVCMNCGHNLQSGIAASTKVLKPKKERKPRGEGSGEWVGYILNPIAISGTYFAISALLMVAFNASPENPVIALGMLGFYGLGSLAIGIFVLLSAFREGIGQGFLTLCVPFYGLYFVYGVCESQWVKWLFTAILLLYGLSFVLIDTVI
ncbi:MAG: hypothetical protein O7G85_04845 [Planctomycetota bacterium]|nr:hypothetical protein [Planctomycetota bacterium]